MAQRLLLAVFTVAIPASTCAFARWGPSSSFSRLSAVNGAQDIENLKTMDVFSLESIRSTLIRQEETIIFALIERAQFRKNSIVYQKGGFGSLGVPVGSRPPKSESDELSFLEYMLVGTEALHCMCRRYTSPEEHSFFPDRLPPHGPMEALPQLQYPSDLLSDVGDAQSINFNQVLLREYIDKVVPSVAKSGDDEQHGSTVLADIAILQALSRRIHYGKFVAESKYRSDPKSYQQLVDSGDAGGVMALLTDALVETKVLRRARLKAATYGTEPFLTELPALECSDAANVAAAAAASAVFAALEAMGQDRSKAGKIDPYFVEIVYRDIVIPLTKVVEVAYLFRRCGREPPNDYQSS